MFLLRKMADLFFVVLKLVRIFTKKTTMYSLLDSPSANPKFSIIDSNSANPDGSIPNPNMLDLNADLTELIVSKLSSIEDHVRFGATCRSWRLAALDARSKLEYHRLSPWMMIGNNSSGSSRRVFFNSGTGEVFQIALPKAMEEACCWGSPYGWIFVASFFGPVYLLNPISRASIPLPRTSILFHRHHKGPHPFRLYQAEKVSYIIRAVLMASPDSADSILFIIYSKSRNLGYVRPGDCTWYSVEGGSWRDVVYFKGNLYGCLCSGKVMMLLSGSAANPNQLNVIEFAAAPPELRDSGENNLKYLVDLDGELCLVVRYYTHIEDSCEFSFPTLEFRIYKLDVCTKSWERVLAMGEKCVFVGANYSHFVQTRCSGLRPNYIYFSDDYSYYQRKAYNGAYALLKRSDMGIYDVGNGQVSALTTPLLVGNEELHLPSCPPLWFTPTLN